MQTPANHLTANFIGPIFVGTCIALLLLSGCTSAPAAEAGAQTSKELAVNRVLDALHREAAAANFDEYFDLYTDNAVFLGTDRSEYWTIDAFRAYAQPHFARGTGWTYTPLRRELHFYANTAWFEEELQSEKYGRVRGTGVLVRGNGGWKVAQYNLTLPIPNPMFGEIAKQIEAHYQGN